VPVFTCRNIFTAMYSFVPLIRKATCYGVSCIFISMCHGWKNITKHWHKSSEATEKTHYMSIKTEGSEEDNLSLTLVQYCSACIPKTKSVTLLDLTFNNSSYVQSSNISKAMKCKQSKFSPVSRGERDFSRCEVSVCVCVSLIFCLYLLIISNYLIYSYEIQYED
jgi:hypothetical protein